MGTIFSLAKLNNFGLLTLVAALLNILDPKTSFSIKIMGFLSFLFCFSANFEHRDFDKGLQAVALKIQPPGAYFLDKSIDLH